MSNTALNTISHHPLLSLHHLSVSTPSHYCGCFLLFTSNCTSVLFPSLFSSWSLFTLYPTSQSSIYPSAVMRKLGLLSQTLCVCVHVVACLRGYGNCISSGFICLGTATLLPDNLCFRVRVCVCEKGSDGHFLGELHVTRLQSPPRSQTISVTNRECMFASLLLTHIWQSLLCLKAFCSWTDADALSVGVVWLYANYFHGMAANVTLKSGWAKNIKMKNEAIWIMLR